jgi:ABC-type antimicrobial peptide transport system permease subunit
MRGPLTIVGVVENARFRSLRDRVRPMLSVPLAQFPRPVASLIVRTESDPAAAVPAIRRAVASVDPELPVFAVRTLRERIGRSLGQERLLASLFAAFGGLALLLAGTGLYGVLASSVEARRRELGIRIALGARRSEVARLVLSRSVRLAAAGLVVGLPLALVAARGLSSLLFGVGPSDPWSFAAAAVVLAAAAAASGAIPALRAARTDPMESLRAE